MNVVRFPGDNQELRKNLLLNSITDPDIAFDVEEAIKTACSISDFTLSEDVRIAVTGPETNEDVVSFRRRNTRNKIGVLAPLSYSRRIEERIGLNSAESARVAASFSIAYGQLVRSRIVSKTRLPVFPESVNEDIWDRRYLIAEESANNQGLITAYRFSGLIALKSTKIELFTHVNQEERFLPDVAGLINPLPTYEARNLNYFIGN